MAGLKDWFPVFKAGNQTSSAGTSKVWTESELDKIVENYKPEYCEAPLVLGHPEGDAPSFGWVQSLKREGDTLFAKCKDIVGEFEQAVKDGRFPYRSISLNPDLTLNHIGFLGSSLPAVKGLGRIAFSEDQNLITYDFMDSETNNKFINIGSIFQRLREFLIDKFDIETADRIIRSWEIEDLSQIVETNSAEAISAFCEKIKEEFSVVTNNPQNKQNAQSSDFSEEIKQKDIENANLKAQIAELESKNRKADFNNFCESLCKEGKLTPVQKGYALDFMEALHGVGEFNFSQGGKKSASEKFQEFLGLLPVQVNFKAVANGQGNYDSTSTENPKELADKAIEYKQSMAQKGIEISISQAVKKVKEGGN